MIPSALKKRNFGCLGLIKTKETKKPDMRKKIIQNYKKSYKNYMKYVGIDFKV